MGRRTEERARTGDGAASRSRTPTGRQRAPPDRRAKQEIAEVRKTYAAKLAQEEILFKSKMQGVDRSEARQMQEHYRRDVERLNHERDGRSRRSGSLGLESFAALGASQTGFSPRTTRSPAARPAGACTRGTSSRRRRSGRAPRAVLRQPQLRGLLDAVQHVELVVGRLHAGDCACARIDCDQIQIVGAEHGARARRPRTRRRASAAPARSSSHRRRSSSETPRSPARCRRP